MKQNNVQRIKCPALVVCKSLNFRNSKSDFSPPTATKDTLVLA